MADYARVYDFSAKDGLTTGDPNKLIKGSEVDGELDAIVTAIATKYDSADLASQVQAEGGALNTVLMTPLRTEQWKDNWLTEAISFTGSELDYTGALFDLNATTVTMDGTTLTATYGSAVLTLTGTEIDLTATTLDFNGLLALSGNGAHTISGGTSAGTLVIDSSHASGPYVTIADSGTPIGDFGTGANMGGSFDANSLAFAARSGNSIQFAANGVTSPHLSITSSLFDVNLPVDFSSTAVFSGNAYIRFDSGGVTTIQTGPLAIHGAIATGRLVEDATNNDLSAFTSHLDTWAHEYSVGSSTAYKYGMVLAARSSTVTPGEGVHFYARGAKVMSLGSAGDLTTPNTSASEVGYKGTPFNVQSGAYTLVLTDAGKFIQRVTGAGTVTIPANASVAFPTGTVITVVNLTGAAISIAITTDTLTWAGVGSTGTRTLADDGVCTLMKVQATNWMISGSGVS